MQDLDYFSISCRTLKIGAVTSFFELHRSFDNPYGGLLLGFFLLAIPVLISLASFLFLGFHFINYANEGLFI